MVRILFWILILFLGRLASEIISYREAENSTSLAGCLIKLGLLLGKVKISVRFSSGYECLSSKVVKALRVPVLVNAAEKDVRNGEIRRNSDLVMILGRANVSRVLSETFWNAETRFLSIYEQEHQMEKDFADFWKYNVINAFGLFKKNVEILFYGFAPYAKETCDLSKPTVVDECVDGRLKNGGLSFSDSDRVSNLNGCSVNVTVADIKPAIFFRERCGLDTTSHVEGFEGRTLNELATKMNFKAAYRCSPRGAGWIMPKPGGAVGSLFKGECDFAMGMLGPTMERFRYLDFSIPYNMDESLLFGVPKGAGEKETSIFYFLLFEFDNYTWMLISLMFLLVFLNFWLNNRYAKIKWLNTNTEILWELYTSFIGLPGNVPNNSSLRFFLTCWIVFSLIITVAYKSAMGSKLTVPAEVPNIDTFEDLVESKLQPGGPRSMFRFIKFVEDKEPAVAALAERFVETNFDTAEAVRLIATERKIAFLRHRSTFLYYALLDPKVRGRIHLTKSVIVSYHPTVTTKKNSFFTRKLNQMIIRLEEAGIVELWRSEFLFKVPAPHKPFVSLGIKRFYGLFLVLGLGYGLSIFCFMFEVWFHVRKQNSFIFFRSKNKRRRRIVTLRPH